MITEDQVSGWFKTKVYMKQNTRDCIHGNLVRKCEICELEKEVKNLKKMLRTSLRLLEALCDGEDCHLDHHGNCQTHGLRNPCENDLALSFISSVKERI